MQITFGLLRKTCVDPEGGTGGLDPPWNLKKKNLKKGNFGILGGGWTPLRL